MVDLISAIRKKVRQLNPNGVVVAQNAAFLIDSQPKYSTVIDGVAFEDTWFSGKEDADWDSPMPATSPIRMPMKIPRPASFANIKSTFTPACRSSRSTVASTPKTRPGFTGNPPLPALCRS